jgi:hypothetical protein
LITIPTPLLADVTQKCSIAVLQETHLDENIENEIKNTKQISLFIVVTVHPQVGG